MEVLARRLPPPITCSSTNLIVRSRLFQCPVVCERAALNRVQLRAHPKRQASSRGSTQSSTKIRAPFKSPTIGDTVTARHIHGHELVSIRSQTNNILTYRGVPGEREILKPLKAIEHAARTITGSSVPEDSNTSIKASPEDPASALLSINASTNTKSSKLRSSTETANTLSTLAYEIITLPTVFITSEILLTYVRIQNLLQKPSTFPEIFDLYATKPMPRLPRRRSRQDEPQVIYKPSNPRAISVAVPPSTATLALRTAVTAKDLHTTLNIIETTFAAPAYRRNKMFRRAMVPAIVAALAPAAAWQIASEMATWQVSLPPEEFTGYAFAGILTYLGGVGMLGYVALTTANDQMQRVTWAVGMPLWERWVREQERAACDLTAIMFGFREKSRWGEETGAEWEEFREFLGLRGMVLDRVNLMEGME